MLHLAQVQKQELSGKLGLRLLARQEAEHSWVVMTDEVVVPTTDVIMGVRVAPAWNEGLLILVELSPSGEIESIQDPTYWILNLVKAYLTNGVTPAFLQQEVERTEKWRQSLTLQSQDLARRSLELEARREQIQALEENLRRDQDDDPE